jgi:hypothetical protein
MENGHPKRALKASLATPFGEMWSRKPSLAVRSGGTPVALLNAHEELSQPSVGLSRVTLPGCSLSSIKSKGKE